MGDKPRSVTLLRLLPAVAGLALRAYSGYALATGRIISTWGNTSTRPDFFYWLTLGALVLIGAGNLFFAVGTRRKP